MAHEGCGGGSNQRTLGRRNAMMLLLVLALSLVLVISSALGLWLWFFHRAAYVKADPHSTQVVIDVCGSDGKNYAIDAVDWEWWLSINPDIVGWITIPGTSVDYPIVHAPSDDPDYYLTHDVYRTYNPYGAIYLDAGCESLFSKGDTVKNSVPSVGNAVIFGHHIRAVSASDAMFAPLAHYSDVSWAEQHESIVIQTPDDGVHALQVQAADIVDGTDTIKRIGFTSETDFLNYWQSCFAEADMHLADEAAQTSWLFTFCTCSYNVHPENERTLTYAVEIASPMYSERDSE